MIQVNANLLEVASFSPYQFGTDSAWMGHLHFSNWIVKELKPALLVELGSHWGHSYFSFCQSIAEADLATKCYAVDTWQGDDHAGLYGDEVFNHVNSHNQNHYASFSRLLRMTFDDALNHFPERSVELLHIDGMHTYEAVKHDFESWLPKLAPGAVVLFHDTNVRQRDFGVWKFWEELQAIYPANLEFLHSHGLGVLQLNDAPESKKLAWLTSSEAEKQCLKDYFAAMGAWARERYQASINHALSERDRQIASLNSQIDEIHASSSWRVTKPLRFLSLLADNFVNKVITIFKRF